MAHQPPPLARAGLIAVGVVALQTLLVLWFAWPAQKTAPRDLPVVVAGPAPAAGAVAGKLRGERPGAFAVTTLPDADAADAALRDRKAYAAFVVTPGGPSLHVASAAAPAVAALLTQAAQQLGNGQPVPVVDVVPAPADDPRGAGFASGFLPLVLTSLAAGIILMFVTGTRTARLVGLLAYGALGGLVATGVLYGLGVLTGGSLAGPGGYLVEAGAVGLLALAAAGSVLGLGAALGRPGAALGVLVVFLVGNPISGLASAPELLPRPWGAVGQFLPPGAGASLLRSVAFFDGAGAGRPLVVLLVWAVVGVALVAVGRARRGVPPAAEPAPAAAIRPGHAAGVS